MLVIQRFCAVSMIALILLAFCCCPVIAAELGDSSASVDNDQDALKEKIKKGYEKFKKGNYTTNVIMNTGSTVHHIVENLSYNNLSGEFEITREADEYRSIPLEEGANPSPRSFMTLFKNGKKILDGGCNLYGDGSNVYHMVNISLISYNEITGAKESKFSIHSMSNVLIYDTDRGFWKLARHTHYTSGEVEVILQISDLLLAGAFTCFFTILGCGGGGIVGLALSITVSEALTSCINSKRNADGSLDTWATLHCFRDWKDESVAPTLSDWCGESNFKKTNWWKSYQSTKQKGKEWMGYDTLFGEFTSKGAAKFRGSPTGIVNAPVYVESG